MTYPTSLDSWTNYATGSTIYSDPSASARGEINELQNAVMALEAKVGKDNSTNPITHDNILQNQVEDGYTDGGNSEAKFNGDDLWRIYINGGSNYFYTPATDEIHVGKSIYSSKGNRNIGTSATPFGVLYVHDDVYAKTVIASHATITNLDTVGGWAQYDGSDTGLVLRSSTIRIQEGSSGYASGVKISMSSAFCGATATEVDDLDKGDTSGHFTMDNDGHYIDISSNAFATIDGIAAGDVEYIMFWDAHRTGDANTGCWTDGTFKITEQSGGMRINYYYEGDQGTIDQFDDSHWDDGDIYITVAYITDG